MAPESHEEIRLPFRGIGVTVRTPAGASSAFAIDRDDTADDLTDRAVAYFAARGQIEPGSFRLGLLRGRTIMDIPPHARLLAEGVVEGDVLHLVTTEPQVDGWAATAEWAEAA